MKRLFKKNQIIITTLAIMIAVAGYLNYSGRIFGESGKAEATNGELAKQELLDITSEDGAQETAGDIESQDQEVADGTLEGTPGEAVLTNGDVTGVVAEAKVTREQVRAKKKETLLEIIDNTNLSDEQKQDAINQMIAMTELAEKEAAVETMLASKGFSDTVVSLTAETADVVVNSAELTDANRAQIEDIITRKAEIAPENIDAISIIVELEHGGSDRDTSFFFNLHPVRHRMLGSRFSFH